MDKICFKNTKNDKQVQYTFYSLNRKFEIVKMPRTLEKDASFLTKAENLLGLYEKYSINSGDVVRV